MPFRKCSGCGAKKSDLRRHQRESPPHSVCRHEYLNFVAGLQKEIPYAPEILPGKYDNDSPRGSHDEYTYMEVERDFEMNSLENTDVEEEMYVFLVFLVFSNWFSDNLELRQDMNTSG